MVTASRDHASLSRRAFVRLGARLTLATCVAVPGCTFLRGVASREEPVMKRITSRDGTTISFVGSGKGPALLLVHGTTADHRRWGPIVPRLEPRFTVYAMDRRGRGASTDAPHYDLLRESEDVAAVVDAIGEPVFLLGHSYGAICSLEAARLTRNVRRLALYEPPLPTGLPLYPPDVPDRIQAHVDEGRLEAALEVFFREVVRMPEEEFAVYRTLPVWPERVRLAPTIARELVFDRSYAFDPARFADMEIPTLLLVGGDSPPIFRRAIDLVHAALPDSQIRILPGQQHIAMDTNPDLFVDEVVGFLLA